jgi:hypothetical protein
LPYLIEYLLTSYCSYLGMVRLGFQAEAQQFFSDFKGDYSEYHNEELQYLSNMTTRDQYNNAEFITRNVFM